MIRLLYAWIRLSSRCIIFLNMPKTPESNAGVGEQADLAARTELLDFLATEGLRKITLLASQLRRLNQEYPHQTDLPAHTFFLERLGAFVELGLTEAGYDDKDVNRVPRSPIRPRRDD